MKWLTDLRERLQRGKNLLRYYLGGLLNRVDEHHVLLLGGGLTFSLFTCIVPFVLILMAVVGNILERGAVAQQVYLLIDVLIPYPEYALFVKRLIEARIQEVRSFKTVAGALGVLGMLFAASGLFSSMRTILHTVFKIDVARSALVVKLRDFKLILFVLCFFLLSTVILPSLEILLNLAGDVAVLNFLRLGILGTIVIWIFSFCIIFGVFFVLYYFVPYRKVEKHVAVMGAFWAALLWEAARHIFGYYIGHFATLGKIYGYYVLFVVVAFWIYYSAVILIVGAEIGQLYRERLRGAIFSSSANDGLLETFGDCCR